MTYQIDSSSDPTANTQLDCYGIVTGNTIGSLVVVDGTDIGNSVNDVVEMLPTAAWGQDLADALMSQHTRTGAHGVITATSIAASTGAFTSLTIGGIAVGGGVNGYTNPNETWLYASPTTITVPSDATLNYQKGDKIQITQGATVKYFYVVGVAATLLTVSPGNDASGNIVTVANSAISSNYYSHQASPVGFPQWMNYTETWTGFSAAPSGGTVRFKLDGRTCAVNIDRTTPGTSNTTACTVTLPITGVAATYRYQGPIGIDDNSTQSMGFYSNNATSGATTMSFYKDVAGTTFTNSGNKNIYGSFFYEI